MSSSGRRAVRPPRLTAGALWAILAVAAVSSRVAPRPPALAESKPPPRPLAIGERAPDFRLPGVDGRTRTLGLFSGAKVLAVLFTCNHCPIAQLHEERVAKLWRDYHERGVVLVAISSNDPKAVRPDELGYTDLGDSFEEMKVRARRKKLPYPGLYDGGQQKAAPAYGPRATPHVFVFDRERRLRYQETIRGLGQSERPSIDSGPGAARR